MCKSGRQRFSHLFLSLAHPKQKYGFSHSRDFLRVMFYGRRGRHKHVSFLLSIEVAQDYRYVSSLVGLEAPKPRLKPAPRYSVGQQTRPRHTCAKHDNIDTATSAATRKKQKLIVPEQKTDLQQPESTQKQGSNDNRCEQQEQRLEKQLTQPEQQQQKMEYRSER